MELELTLKNYRCFADAAPARFALRPGATAFVGPNNSGKSTVLRLFLELRHLFQQISPSRGGEFFPALQGNQRVFNVPPHAADLRMLFCNSNERPLKITVSPRPTSSEEKAVVGVLKHLEITVPHNTNYWTVSLTNNDDQVYSGHSLGFGDNMIQHPEYASIGVEILDIISSMLAQTLYIGPFRNVVNIGTNEDYFDMKVGQALVSNWRSLKTGPNSRNNEACYRIQDQIARIFGYQRVEINPSPGDDTLQVFLDGLSYRIHELGSGFTQFFVVLANAHIQHPHYILIDEPELHLHPSLQMDFLTTLASYAQSGVLFATHSVGLARTAADVTYSVRRPAGAPPEVTPWDATPRLSELLGELSFSGYRELGFRKVLLVEGPTDIKTFHQFLKIVGKDRECVLLPLGGSSMINGRADEALAELTRISDDIYAVIDSERSEKGEPLSQDRLAFEEVCARLGIRCHVLERRATENYLTDAAVKRALGEQFSALAEYDDPRNARPFWGKERNWRIAMEMKLEDLEGTDLGQLLTGL